MSQLGSQPTSSGPSTDLSQSQQPLIPPPRTSSREPSPASRAAGANSAGREQTSASHNLDIPVQDEALTGVSGETVTSSRPESIGRNSKRSLIGRRREGSNASKGSARMAALYDEKSTRPGSAGRLQSSGQSRSRMKGGFFAFLNCCGSSEDVHDGEKPDSAQPARVPPKAQPTSVQPPPMRQHQNVGTTANITEESKNVYDEKSGHGVVVGGSAAPATEPERSTFGNAAMEKPLPIPREDLAIHQNPEIRPPEDGKPIVQADAATGQPRIEPSIQQQESQYAANNPHVSVQAPTPVVATIPNNPIADRTPQQEQRDEDIEMSDAGVSVPITAAEGEAIAEDERRQHELQQRQLPHQDVRADDDDDMAASRAMSTTTTLPVDQEEPQSDLAAAGLTQRSSFASSPEPPQKWLLPPIRPEHSGRKCLVLDLDETLVHSSFKVLHQADFTIPVEIEGQYHSVYVIKRPGVDAFLKRVGELYEVAVFTASVSKYGDPVLDNLDIHKVVHHRLFRESCYNHQGNYVKDLSQIGRDLRETIIIDNSPTSYIFHPQHAVPISSWFSDAHDNELLDLIPVLEDLAGPQVADVSLVLDVAL